MDLLTSNVKIYALERTESSDVGPSGLSDYDNRERERLNSLPPTIRHKYSDSIKIII